jgi:hypothetical protein
MNKLNFKPEFQLDGDDGSARGPAMQDHASADGMARSQTAERGSRRRSSALRLRLRTDDGFHPFRVY